MKRSTGLTLTKLGLLVIFVALFFMPPDNNAWAFAFAAGCIALFVGLGGLIFGKHSVGGKASKSGAGWAAAGAAGMAGTAAASSMDTGPTVNVDGTPMVHGTNVDIHGNPFGVTSPSFNIDGTPMHSGGMTDFNGNAYGHTSDHSFSSSSDPFKHD